jgi:hypothetical protein
MGNERGGEWGGGHDDLERRTRKPRVFRDRSAALPTGAQRLARIFDSMPPGHFFWKGRERSSTAMLHALSITLRSGPRP